MCPTMALQRAVVGFVAAIALLIVPIACVVQDALAHSQLVASLPAPGERLAASPPELRLVFSEALTPGYSTAEVNDAAGASIPTGPATVGPTDDHVLTVVLPSLTTGTYDVTWRTLSAADGHVEGGSFAFAVDPAAASPDASIGAVVPNIEVSPPGDTLHAGHDSGETAVEIQGKTLAYGGSMIAFGLAVVAWGVLRPALNGRLPRPFVLGVGVANLAGALGVGLLIVVSVASLAASPEAGATTAAGAAPAANPPVDGAAFVFGTRPGQLLFARLVLAAVTGGASLVFAARRRGGGALAVGGVGGGLGIVLIAISGHAVAFGSPIPVVVDIVHVGGAGLWLGGLLSLAALTDFGGRFDPPTLREVIPRYSVLALVSVGLMAAAGIYATWVQTGDLVSFGSAYALNLDLKVVLVAAALAIGAVNFLDGGRHPARFGGLSRRILAEAGLAIGVVVVTANLTSGSPSGEDRPIPLAAVRSAPDQPTGLYASLQLGVQPGRPGLNRFIASVGDRALPNDTELTLVVQPADAADQATRAPLRATADTTGRIRFVADLVLAANTRYYATVVIVTRNAEQGNLTYSLSLDATHITAGRELPPIDPIVVIGVGLIAAGFAGVGWALRTAALPRRSARWGRLVIGAGSVIGLGLGALIIVGGPIS